MRPRSTLVVRGWGWYPFATCMRGTSGNMLDPLVELLTPPALNLCSTVLFLSRMGKLSRTVPWYHSAISLSPAVDAKVSRSSGSAVGSEHGSFRHIAEGIGSSDLRSPRGWEPWASLQTMELKRGEEDTPSLAWEGVHWTGAVQRWHSWV